MFNLLFRLSLRRSLDFARNFAISKKLLVILALKALALTIEVVLNFLLRLNTVHDRHIDVEDDCVVVVNWL